MGSRIELTGKMRLRGEGSFLVLQVQEMPESINMMARETRSEVWRDATIEDFSTLENPFYENVRIAGAQ